MRTLTALSWRVVNKRGLHCEESHHSRGSVMCEDSKSHTVRGSHLLNLYVPGGLISRRTPLTPFLPIHPSRAPSSPVLASPAPSVQRPAATVQPFSVPCSHRVIPVPAPAKRPNPRLKAIISLAPPTTLSLRSALSLVSVSRLPSLLLLTELHLRPTRSPFQTPVCGSPSTSSSTSLSFVLQRPLCSSRSFSLSLSLSHSRISALRPSHLCIDTSALQF